MSRVLVLVVALACAQQAAPRPVKKTLNFNMFVLRPRQDAVERVLLTTDGVSRFGPLLEYLVQRIQGLMSVRLPQEQADPLRLPDINVADPTGVPVADASENEVDPAAESKAPGVVVRPSRTKPGTFEVEINVVVDDGQPDKQTDNDVQ